MAEANLSETIDSIAGREPNLRADTILAAEFEYIAESAFQANEDRARLSTYYVVTFGTLLAAIFSQQVVSSDPENLYLALIIVFAALSIFGITTLLQLVRLRKAWTECAIAMNQIKDYYADQLQHIRLTDAFRWKMSTLPQRFKPDSVAFLLAIQVATLSSISLGTCVYFLGLLTGLWAWIPAFLSALLYLAVQVWLYRHLLKS